MKDTIAWEGGTLSAEWHEPAKGDTYLVLAHGAGGNMHAPSLRAFADALAAGGVGAVRFNLPYAEAGKGSPGPQARNEAGWRAVAAHVTGRAAKVFLGGRSYGGRLASHIVAAGTPASGLVFLAYPLHPPGKPERIRDAHLRDIRVPMLFLQGTRDPFATPSLLDATIASLADATLHRVEGGDHSHKVRGRSPAEVNDELCAVTLDWIATR